MKTGSRIILSVMTVLIICAALAFSSCSKEKTEFNYRFAAADEAAEMLLSNRDYYESLNQNDLNFRVQKKGATLEELEKIAADQTRDFTDEEKAAIDSALDTIASTCEERGYTLPDSGEIVFAKTTMKEECDAGAYTHGTEIYIGEDFMKTAVSEDEESQTYFHEIIAHELFHCLTRNNPDFRADMYSILGFTVVDKDYDFPEETRSRIIGNPDVEHHNSYATFTIDGEKKDCTVIFTTTEPFEKPGDSFFDSRMTGLVPVDDLSKVYSSEDASDFWSVFGKNTKYVIDPEETLADNFRFTIVYGTDGKDYENPEIIQAIDEYLKK